MRTSTVTIQSVKREKSRIQGQLGLMFTVFEEDGTVFFPRESFSSKVTAEGPNAGKTMFDTQSERMAKFLDQDEFRASDEELKQFIGQQISVMIDDETWIDGTSQEEKTAEAVKSMILGGGHGLAIDEWTPAVAS